MLLLYFLRIVPNWKAKEIVCGYFFKGIEVAVFKERAQCYSEQKLPAIVKDSALEEILRHKGENTRVAIVSATFEPYLQGWCDKNGFDLLGTRLEVKDGKLTGKFLGKNCHGEEKVRRIKQKYNFEEIEYVYAYGDTRGDKAMMNLADESFYRKF